MTQSPESPLICEILGRECCHLRQKLLHLRSYFTTVQGSRCRRTVRGGAGRLWRPPLPGTSRLVRPHRPTMCHAHPSYTNGCHCFMLARSSAGRSSCWVSPQLSPSLGIIVPMTKGGKIKKPCKLPMDALSVSFWANLHTYRIFSEYRYRLAAGGAVSSDQIAQASKNCPVWVLFNCWQIYSSHALRPGFSMS